MLSSSEEYGSSSLQGCFVLTALPHFQRGVVGSGHEEPRRAITKITNEYADFLERVSNAVLSPLRNRNIKLSRYFS